MELFFSNGVKRAGTSEVSGRLQTARWIVCNFGRLVLLQTKFVGGSLLSWDLQKLGVTCRARQGLVILRMGVQGDVLLERYPKRALNLSTK